MERKKYIYYVKFLAVLLVLNSHLDNVYPLAVFATGGAIGNCLFFFNSGYTWSNLKKLNFVKWFSKKIKIIWFPTIFTNFIYLIFYFNKKINFINLFKLFIYPNKSWFCGAILLYSIGYYYLVKNNNKLKNILYFLTGIIIYIFYYIFYLNKTIFSIEAFSVSNLCRLIFYFECMCFAFYFKTNENNFEKNRYKCLICSIISLISIYLLKYLMQRYKVFLNIQFLNQVLTFLFVLFLFRFLQLSENKLKNNKIINWIADYSWEIYLTQTLIIPYLSKIVFPLNLLLIIISIIMSSILLKRIILLFWNFADNFKK